MLRVAVPNKGTLSESATEMLREAGYSLRKSSKTLVHVDSRNDIEFFYLRPRDIAIYIGRGVLDIGITGRDLLAESRADATEVLPLGFGKSWFRYAGPEGRFSDPVQLAGKRIATSYPELVRADLDKRGIAADIVTLDGAVEVSIQLGVADAIADVVQTGTTLRTAGLEIFGEELLASEGILISHGEPAPAAQTLLRRMESVMVARAFVLVDYNVQADRLAEVTEITPGLESPTIMPLEEDGWVAARAMVRADDVHAVMDRLYDLGARAILVSSIGACRI
ncbi:ATP phosphoribosyltransferase [Brevibacterium sp. 50QC2O2]|jgi:ATP phosphoribosyltransferase|uniref:ATP phosphoribosyltransferase n=1 Tax=Brevibacterium TaxID=1696 RepID=UPI00211C1329|nr:MULTISPECIES: ATP phosphoribosyltransferase [unclassified Brevibacterium]MCQ9366870.1 ATP phosphoribosyltransferase [Brevibacterium sp. 91QC2O2]MCQ9384020.1 ATP phosphoribosyltransferase [Brevibacterium sp. 68QC2CO]MCQ9389126.1 ATP phosphoribosyltransferase [Brevibacterium sp. 50QC2O2]